MEWTALELRKASVLRKEGNCSSIFTIACDCDEMSVDLAIRLIQQAVENDDQKQLEELINSIQQRTLEIEEFYAQNDEGIFG
jgi:hypothetical protein